MTGDGKNTQVSSRSSGTHYVEYFLNLGWENTLEVLLQNNLYYCLECQ
jgi:hypothetical protein